MLDFFLAVLLTHSFLSTLRDVPNQLPVFHGHKIHTCPRQEPGDHRLLEGGAGVKQGLPGLRNRSRLKRRFLWSGSEVASQLPCAVCHVSSGSWTSCHGCSSFHPLGPALGFLPGFVCRLLTGLQKGISPHHTAPPPCLPHPYLPILSPSFPTFCTSPSTWALD